MTGETYDGGPKLNLKESKAAALEDHYSRLMEKVVSEVDDGKRITLLLTAGIVRDELHRRGERRRTNLMLALTFLIAFLTFVVARASPDAFNFHPTKTERVVVVPLSLAPSPPPPRDWH